MKNVGSYYKLTSVEVSPKNLKLDPNNPRLSLGWNTDRKYKDNEIRSEALQSKIEETILTGKHHLKELIHSIETKGFVTGAQPIIVSRIGTTNDFLVLEGNRRTTAIRKLAGSNGVLDRSVAKSIASIPVQIFEYIPNKAFDRDEVIDILLGTIHIEGPEEWGAMERAYYIYRSYCRELNRSLNVTRFQYDADVASKVGESFSLTMGQTKEVLGIFRVFNQLKSNSHEVNSDDFSLIQLAIKPKCVEYFRYDTENLKMTAEGLDRFGSLCLGTNPVIKNPSDFNAFAYVITHGTPYEQSQILDEGKSPQEIKKRVLRRGRKFEFRDDLEDIKDQLDKLRPSQYQGTQVEIKLIEDIRNSVESLLVSLTKKGARN